MSNVYFFKNADVLNLDDIPAELLPEDRLHKADGASDIKYITSVLGEAVLRTVIIKKMNIDNSQIAFVRPKSGKPYLKYPRNFYFNISHSGSAVAVAVSNSEIGIDIEKYRNPDLRVAQRYFTAGENDYIKNSSNPDFAFFEIWTAKEAFAKYNGSGISVPFFKTSVTDKDIKDKIFTVKKDDFFISVCSENAASTVIKDIDLSFFDENCIH